jgi:hypothetical protein
VINQITLVRCSYGSNIELFQYSSPDQKTVTPKNSDVGGYHIAFYVDDIKRRRTISAAGCEDLLWSVPGERRAGRRAQHRLLPRALGPVDGDPQLSERDGLREIVSDGAVVAARPGEVRGHPDCGLFPRMQWADWL